MSSTCSAPSSFNQTYLPLSTPLIVGNWKMNLTRSSAKELAQVYVDASKELTTGALWLAPSFTSLSCVYEVVKKSSVALGAQNAHWKTEGAFTGEVSIPMIREAGCSFVIVGHSERRQYFGETNETVARRVRAALLQGLTCILCVGEGIDDRVQGTTNHVLREQLRTALFDTSFNDDGIEPDKQWSIQSHLGGLVIAYEPIWAIGTGKVASLEEISDAHTFIRAFLKEKIGVDTTPILYGGSVKGSNVRDILSTFGVSGALVGGASLIPEEVYSFAQACQG